MKVRATMTPHLHHVTDVTILSTDGAQAVIDGSAAMPIASVVPVTIDAAAVNAITGLTMRPVDAKQASRGDDAYLAAGASTAAFSDGTNMVAIARAPAAGPALTMLAAAEHLPGLLASKVEGLGGEASWIAGRTLVLREADSLLVVVTNMPGIDAARRLEIARALVQRADQPSVGASPSASPPAAAPSPPTPA